MSNFTYFIKSLFYYLFFKSIFLFNFISYTKFLIIKISKKEKYYEFLSFFENYENKIKTQKPTKKKCIHINFFNWFDSHNYLFSYFIFSQIGSKYEQLIFFNSFKINLNSKNKKIEFTKPLNFYSQISFIEVNKITNNLMKKTYDEIFNFKFKDIKCGKYAISSSIRKLKTPKISLKNKYHYFIVKFFFFKSIIFADASINFLKNNKDVECAVFNDKSYVGAGELYDESIKRGIKCVQFVASYKNNLLLLKKYNSINKDDHPSAISKNLWEKYQNIKITSKQSDYLQNEILSEYENNSWFPSAGTTVGKKVLNIEELKTELNVNASQKIAIIFPHIFWDGTFFFGKDLFGDYIEWYKETLIAANKNKNLKWIIKSHPSNIIKNNREKISNKKIDPELKIIYDLFGDIPDHFEYLSSKSKISSIRLFDILDFCFTIRGTVGIEAALKNKIVITAGTGRYNNRGFTINFDNKEKYFEMISNLHLFKNNNTEIKSNAEKFAYISFICKTIQFNPARFFYKKNNIADLNLKINYQEFDKKSYRDKLIKFNNWMDNSDSDYFEDPCNEWSSN